MVDREKVVLKLRKLEDTLRKLKDFASVSWEGYRDDEALQDRAERNLQLAAQACIDIAHHVVADRGWPTPRTYGQAFAILAENGMLPQDLARKMMQIAAFRNILVHDYTELDAEKVYEALQQYGDFAEFARQAAAWLDDES